MQGRRHPLSRNPVCRQLERYAGGLLTSLLIALTCVVSASAGADPRRSSPVFYHQLIDLNDNNPLPARTLLLVTDEDGRHRLVADDDPHLAFNLLWLEQHQQGYRYREGGAALGKLFRAILRQAWDNYRDDGGGAFLSMVHTEEESITRSYRPGSSYDLRVSDDEIELGFEYRW